MELIPGHDCKVLGTWLKVLDVLSAYLSEVTAYVVHVRYLMTVLDSIFGRLDCLWLQSPTQGVIVKKCGNCIGPPGPSKVNDAVRTADSAGQS